MSIVDLWNKLVNFIKNFPEFVEKNYSNPIFWLGMVAVLFIMCRLAIDSFSDK